MPCKLNLQTTPHIQGNVLASRNDLAKAMEQFEWCCQKHRATPWKNELACKMIQAEDAVSLQKLTDLSTQVHGEVNSLYDLVFAFVECGRIRQARKILEVCLTWFWFFKRVLYPSLFQCGRTLKYSSMSCSIQNHVLLLNVMYWRICVYEHKLWRLVKKKNGDKFMISFYKIII